MSGRPLTINIPVQPWHLLRASHCGNTTRWSSQSRPHPNDQLRILSFTAMYDPRAVDRSRAHVAPVDVHCICSCWFQSYVRLSSGRPLKTWAFTPATTFTGRRSPGVRGRPNAAHRECPEVRSHCWFRSGRPLKHTLCCDVQLYPPCYWCTRPCSPLETSPSDVRAQSP